MTMLATYLHLCLSLIHNGDPMSLIVGLWMMLAPVLLLTLTVAQIVSWRMEDRRNAQRDASYAELTARFRQEEIDLWN